MSSLTPRSDQPPRERDDPAPAARITADEQAELALVAAEFLAQRAAVEFAHADPATEHRATAAAAPAPEPDTEATRLTDRTESAPVASPPEPDRTVFRPRAAPAREGTVPVAAAADGTLAAAGEPLASLWETQSARAEQPHQAAQEASFDALLQTVALEPLPQPSATTAPVTAAPPPAAEPHPAPPAAVSPVPTQPGVPRMVWLGVAALAILNVLSFAILWAQVAALRQAPPAAPSAVAADPTAPIATAIALLEQRILGLESRLGEMAEALTALERTADDLTARAAPPSAAPAPVVPSSSAEQRAPVVAEEHRAESPAVTPRSSLPPPAAAREPVSSATAAPSSPGPAPGESRDTMVLDAPRYTIQLAAFERESSAWAFVRAQRLDERETYLARSGPQGRMYAVVVGLFDTNEAALAALARLPEPHRNQGWSRRLTAGSRLLRHPPETTGDTQ